jgi:hypothetical protein
LKAGPVLALLLKSSGQGQGFTVLEEQVKIIIVCWQTALGLQEMNIFIT